MGYSQAAKSRSHELIVDIAAARFRERGFAGVGVADLMNEAGLTHGGFYRHFDSRDALVEEALEHALAQGDARMKKAADTAGRAPLAALVDQYLSSAHRDDVDSSCAVCTLANDVARSSDHARAAYTEQVERYVALIGQLLATQGTTKARRRRAIQALSSMVGALAMARAVNDSELSLEILKTAAEGIKSTAD